MKQTSKHKLRRRTGISGSGLRLLDRIMSGQVPKRFKRFEGKGTGYKLGRAYE